jgi:site-specific recombinase XerD
VRTVEGYFIDLREFFRYIKISRGLVSKETKFEKISILDVNLDLIESVRLTDVFEFMNYMASVRNNNNNTRSRKCSSLRSFYHYLYSTTGQIKHNPVQELSNPKIAKKLPKYLDLEQSIDLLNSVEGKFKERDYCILTLFLNCGMRLSELVGINLSDIRSDNSLRITGKGNKQRVIYLNEACVNAINAYKRVRPVDGVIDRDALFISQQRKRISPKTVQHLVKKYLSKINLCDGYSTHKLRHTAATLMYQQGNVDTRVLKDILGHENMNTTEIYTHLSSEQIKGAINSNPLAHLNRIKK